MTKNDKFQENSTFLNVYYLLFAYAIFFILVYGAFLFFCFCCIIQQGHHVNKLVFKGLHFLKMNVN